MLFKAAFYPVNRKALNKASEEGKHYQIYVEKEAEFKPSQYNNFFDSLYTIYDPKHRNRWVSFEFWGTHKGIGLYSWLSGGVSADFMQSNINSVHPAAEIVPVEKDYAAFGKHYGKDVSCATLELDSHYLFNLLQSDGERAGADVMASLCSSMQNLGDHEEVAVQFLLRPVHYKALNIVMAYYDLYKKYGKRPSKLHYPYAKYNPYLEVPKALIGAAKHTVLGSAGAKEHTQSLTPIQKKLEAGVFFDLLIRIVTISDQWGKASDRLTSVISAFAPTTDKNRFRPYRSYFDKTYFNLFKVQNRSKFLKDFESRRVHTYPIENYVTPAELATVLHFPSKDIPGVIRLRSKKIPVPDGVIKYDSVEEAWKDGAIVFGVSNFRGRKKYLAFKDIRMLMQHSYIIGATGSGKSYLLTFIALQISRHTGFTFFDVKGDIVDLLLEHLPESEWHRVVYIDLQEDEWFIPFNVLRQPGMTVYNLATMIVGVFVKVFSSGSIKEHSQTILRQALISVIATDPKGSLLEVYRMFTDENYLDATIKKLEANGEYPDVLNYWKNTYKPMKPSARKNEAGAILNKLQTITQNERPRYTLSQTDNILKWRRMMDQKAIILVNLSMGQNEDEILNFFGTLFTAFISKATFSRDDTREENRVPHLFFLDEFERFVHQGAEMAKFLEMSRSYGLGLVLAHQSVKQIPEDLLGMIEDNTFSQITLNIGTGSNTKISKMFPGVHPEDLINLDNYQGFARFKKLHPAPFTFDSIDVRDHYQSIGHDKVKRFKDNYKRQNYKHLLAIKEEINERYSLVEKNLITEEESPGIRGNASGQLRKGASRNGKVIEKPQVIPL
ncbi:type IV secretory system conjugative DNA transfer family protein [Ammoniphilus resinae]|uniref:DUF8128 domain-containing protein n=1 Tax=Ammoniphilus resinae TaxID=861532 RepID=A0ABS4GX75_9BACL|nr:type IV secretory system conjugative DNA transfer family protein [Ammoniphilus resinae]MBP1934874.1 hypothetical protein [Ammoniphilus resinae]